MNCPRTQSAHRHYHEAVYTVTKSRRFPKDGSFPIHEAEIGEDPTCEQILEDDKSREIVAEVHWVPTFPDSFSDVLFA